MSATSSAEAPPSVARRRGGLAALALVPFAVLVLLFLLLPGLALLAGSFQAAKGGAFTLDNFSYLSGDNKSLQPFVNSFIVSFGSMVLGGALGVIVAQALVSSKSPRLEQLTITFSSVAANFAGVPLAFAYIATIGAAGLVTKLLAGLGLDIYGAGFTIYSMLGLTIVYTYFQLPLMVLLILPALKAVRPEWREASDNLGADRWRYLQAVAIPVLTPSLVASLLLLFANSFGAYATAYALTTGFISLVPISISNVIAGNVFFDPGLGDALAVGLAAVMTICVGGQALLQRRASRWLNR
jgi:putative spermidine/putrescine transport system permease protein